MTTGLDELQYSTMTRLAGQTENVALDVEEDCGKNRAYTSAISRIGGIVNAAVSVTNVSTLLKAGVANATNRLTIVIQNLGTLSIYIGGSGVTVSNGIRVDVGETWILSIAESASLYAIAASGSHNIRVMEGVL